METISLADLRPKARPKTPATPTPAQPEVEEISLADLRPKALPVVKSASPAAAAGEPEEISLADLRPKAVGTTAAPVAAITTPPIPASPWKSAPAISYTEQASNPSPAVDAIPKVEEPDPIADQLRAMRDKQMAVERQADAAVAGGQPVNISPQATSPGLNAWKPIASAPSIETSTTPTGATPRIGEAEGNKIAAQNRTADLDAMAAKPLETGDRTFSRVVDEALTTEKAMKMVPFAGGAKELADAVDVYNAVQRFDKGAASARDLDVLLRFHTESQRDTTWGGSVANILVELPAFAGEIAATGGLYTAGRKTGTKATAAVVRKVLGDVLSKRVAARAAQLGGWAVGSAAQAAVAMPARAATDLIERRTGKLDLSDDGKLIINSPDDSFLTSAYKAVGSSAIEVASEHTGKGIGKVASKALSFVPGSSRAKALKAALAAKWMDQTGLKSSDLFAKTKQFTAWDGVLQEIGEEEVGKAMRWAAQIEDYKLTTPSEFAAQVVAFSVPGGAARAIEYGEGKLRDRQNTKAGQAIAGEVAGTGTPAGDTALFDAGEADALAAMEQDAGLPMDAAGQVAPPQTMTPEQVAQQALQTAPVADPAAQQATADAASTTPATAAPVDPVATAEAPPAQADPAQADEQKRVVRISKAQNAVDAVMAKRGIPAGAIRAVDADRYGATATFEDEDGVFVVSANEQIGPAWDKHKRKVAEAKARQLGTRAEPTLFQQPTAQPATPNVATATPDVAAPVATATETQPAPVAPAPTIAQETPATEAAPEVAPVAGAAETQATEGQQADTVVPETMPVVAADAEVRLAAGAGASEFRPEKQRRLAAFAEANKGKPAEEVQLAMVRAGLQGQQNTIKPLAIAISEHGDIVADQLRINADRSEQQEKNKPTPEQERQREIASIKKIVADAEATPIATTIASKDVFGNPTRRDRTPKELAEAEQKKQAYLDKQRAILKELDPDGAISPQRTETATPDTAPGSTPPPAGGEAGAKQPWEMTRAEFVASHRNAFVSETGKQNIIGVRLADGNIARLAKGDQSRGKANRDVDDILGDIHRRAVSDHVQMGKKAKLPLAAPWEMKAAGKPVPASVLADYPDLAAQYPASRGPQAESSRTGGPQADPETVARVNKLNPKALAPRLKSLAAERERTNLSAMTAKERAAALARIDAEERLIQDRLNPPAPTATGAVQSNEQDTSTPATPGATQDDRQRNTVQRAAGRDRTTQDAGDVGGVDRPGDRGAVEARGVPGDAGGSAGGVQQGQDAVRGAAEENAAQQGQPGGPATPDRSVRPELPAGVRDEGGPEAQASGVSGDGGVADVAAGRQDLRDARVNVAAERDAPVTTEAIRAAVPKATVTELEDGVWRVELPGGRSYVVETVSRISNPGAADNPSYAQDLANMGGREVRTASGRVIVIPSTPAEVRQLLQNPEAREAITARFRPVATYNQKTRTVQLDRGNAKAIELREEAFHAAFDQALTEQEQQTLIDDVVPAQEQQDQSPATVRAWAEERAFQDRLELPADASKDTPAQAILRRIATGDIWEPRPKQPALTKAQRAAGVFMDSAARVRETIVDWARKDGYLDQKWEQENPDESGHEGYDLVQNHNPFHFAGKIPPEVKHHFEGMPHILTMFKADVPGGRGQDAFESLGDEYFEIVERMAGGKAAEARRAVELAENFPEPAPRFHAWLLRQYEQTREGQSTRPASGAKKQPGKLRPKVMIDADSLPVGSTFTIEGETLAVETDENDNKVIRHAGDAYQTAGLPRIPIDHGSLKAPQEPSSLPEKPDDEVPFSVRDTGEKKSSDLGAIEQYWSRRDWTDATEARDMIRRRIVETNNQYGAVFGKQDPAIVDQLQFTRAAGGRVKIKTSRAVDKPDTPNPFGAENPTGDAPRVDWDAADNADDGTPASIMKEYGRGKGRIYRAWVFPGDLPTPKGEDIHDGVLDDDTIIDHGGRGVFPPIKIRIGPRGKIELMDGNHRLAYWRERGYDAVPAYVIDERGAPTQTDDKQGESGVVSFSVRDTGLFQGGGYAGPIDRAEATPMAKKLGLTDADMLAASRYATEGMRDPQASGFARGVKDYLSGSEPMKLEDAISPVVHRAALDGYAAAERGASDADREQRRFRQGQSKADGETGMLFSVRDFGSGHLFASNAAAVTGPQMSLFGQQDVTGRTADDAKQPAPVDLFQNRLDREPSYVPPVEQESDTRPTPAATGRIEDAGEKIGGAKKDRWRARGLMASDMEEMTDIEVVEHTKKENVWAVPDYRAMVDGGADPVALLLKKRVRDGLPAKPKHSDRRSAARYIQNVAMIRDTFAKANTVEDVVRKGDEVFRSLGWDLSGRSWAASDSDKKATFELYRGRTAPWRLTPYDVADAKITVKNTNWPNIEKQPAWGKVYLVRQKSDGSWFAAFKKTRLTAKSGFATEQEAVAWAEGEAGDRTKAGGQPVRPQLAHIERAGTDFRGGKDVDANDFIQSFGFRGVEFGNWTNQEDRRQSLNHAFDALMDLAQVMGIPPKAVSLNGRLALAFGARGGGRFAAHYEPGRRVINLTKLSGAGALAHEWAHAFDHHLGDQAGNTPLSPMASNTPTAGSKLRAELRETFASVQRSLVGVVRNAADLKRDLERKRGELGPMLRRMQKELDAKATPEQSAAAADLVNAIVDGHGGGQEMQQFLQLRRDVGFQGDERFDSVFTRPAFEKAEAQAAYDAALMGETVVSRSGTSKYLAEAYKLDAGKQKPYWSTGHELFARAFEAWMFDRITTSGRSDYLVHSVGEYIGAKGQPYPMAQEERTRIGEAFDRLTKTLLVSEDDAGKTNLYSIRDFGDPARQGGTDTTPKTPAINRGSVSVSDVSTATEAAPAQATDTAQQSDEPTWAEWFAQMEAEEATAKQKQAEHDEKTLGQMMLETGAYGDTVGATKAAVAEERKAWGLPGLPSVPSRTWKAAHDAAVADGLPDRAVNLAQGILLKPRPLTDIEKAGMLAQGMKLKTLHKGLRDKLVAAKDPQTIAEIAGEMSRVEADVDVLTQALDIGGSESGRSLNAQKMVLNEDFDLLSVLIRAKAAKGSEATTEERARFDEMIKKLQQAEAKIAEMEKERHEKTVRRAMDRSRERRTKTVTVEQIKKDAHGIATQIAELLKAGCTPN